MSGKIRDYQVVDVLCGGTYYKVRHKVTNKIFAWKAYDCSNLSKKQIEDIVSDVKIVASLQDEALLRYHDTILHAPSRTLYIVVEHPAGRSLAELAAMAADGVRPAEGFVWRLLLSLARAVRRVQAAPLRVLTRRLAPAALWPAAPAGALQIDPCHLPPPGSVPPVPLMAQLGALLSSLCLSVDKISPFTYSDDLQDMITFLTDKRNANLSLDVILYHPTVLANLEAHSCPENVDEVFVSKDDMQLVSSLNKCDSEKAVELCKVVEPMQRKYLNGECSPLYSNVTPKLALKRESEESTSSQGSLSPTLAALALELPGFVPRSRKPIHHRAVDIYNPQKVSEETLSQQWMTRLVALRQREDSLNKRERELISKEIVNSPAAKVVPAPAGITLPPGARGAAAAAAAGARRRRRSARRRQSCGYLDLDSSLSADAGDGSPIITAARITKDNMPRRTIFPDVSSKKVHFAASNPFAESDESVTLTFYELENVDREGYQVPRRDIDQFKYLDVDKMAAERRTGRGWAQGSPAKQPRALGDVTNTRPPRASLAPAADLRKSKRRSLLPFKTPFKFMTSTKN